MGELTPGRHGVRITKEGFFDWRSDVFVEPGNTTPLWANLEEVPPEWWETWWFWSIVGGVAVGAATVVYVGSQAPLGGGKVGFDD